MSNLYKKVAMTLSYITESGAEGSRKYNFLNMSVEKRFLLHASTAAVVMGLTLIFDKYWFTLLYYFGVLLKEIYIDPILCSKINSITQFDSVTDRYNDVDLNSLTMHTKAFVDFSQHCTGSFIVLFIYNLFV
ncbi:MAG: hypothetical protein WC934_11835 [Acidithiobacillus sp.]|jgi:hypothetical protein|uniref:hypothetical protein n=1 Tax=Acidithiobacillus sp. TaxID=1872118 RepID=UPI00355E10A1